jgi:hypothetical protein
VWEPGKPSQNENEYFARRDAEWLKERRAQLDAERAVKATGQQAITCPRGHGELTERSVQNVKIDVCRTCHGVWLDTGELEMILHVPRGELLRAVGELDRKRGAT